MLRRTPGHGLVQVVGLEPTLHSEADFKSAASTNSATPACVPAYDVCGARVHPFRRLRQASRTSQARGRGGWPPLQVAAGQAETATARSISARSVIEAP